MEHNFEWSVSKQHFICRNGGDDCGLTIETAAAVFTFKEEFCCGDESFFYKPKDLFECKACGYREGPGDLIKYLHIGELPVKAGPKDHKKIMAGIEKIREDMDLLYGSIGMDTDEKLNPKLSPNGLEFTHTKYSKAVINGKEHMMLALSISKKASDEKHVIKFGASENLSKYISKACGDLKTEIVRKAIEYAKLDVTASKQDAVLAIREMETYLGDAKRLLGISEQDILNAAAPENAEKKKRKKKETVVEVQPEAKAEGV